MAHATLTDPQATATILAKNLLVEPSFATLDNAIATMLALASALTIAWGTVTRHQLADDLPTNTGTIAGVAKTLRRWQWWFGAGLAMTGYALQLVALKYGALLLVQPLLVMSLMFTLPLSAKMNGRRISKGETAWAVLLTAAVATLVGLGRPTAGDPTVSLKMWLPVLGFGAAVFGLLYWAGATILRSRKAFIYGSATGWLYGYVALLSKTVMDIFNREGIDELMKSWELWLLVALAFIGVAVQQAAFNAGTLQQSLPPMTIVEPIVAFALGYIVLGEYFMAHGWQWAFMAIALVTMIVSTVQLARRPVAA